MDELLKYVLPNDARQRIAGRHAAVFVGVIVAALLIALGGDTLNIISAFIKSIAKPDRFDLALTTTSISILVALVFAGIVYGAHWSRCFLIKLWSGHLFPNWFRHFITRKQQPYGASSMQLLERVQSLLDPSTLIDRATNASRDEMAKKSKALWQKKLHLKAKEQIQAYSSKAGAFGKIVAATQIHSLTAKLEELEKTIDVNDWKTVDFRSQSKNTSRNLRRHVHNIVARLDDLRARLDPMEKIEASSQSTDPMATAKVDAPTQSSMARQAPPPATKATSNQTAPLREDELIVNWIEADDCEAACLEFEEELDRANSRSRFVLAHWIDISGYADIVASICERLKEDIVDLPYFAPKRINESFKDREYRFKPGFRFGSIVERTSLGQGSIFLREMPGHYYANTSDASDAPLRYESSGSQTGGR